MVLVGAAYAVNEFSDLRKSSTFSDDFQDCFLQSVAGYSIANPYASTAVSNAVEKLQGDRSVDAKELGTELGLNLLKGELRENGHSDVANMIDVGLLINCIKND